MGTKIEFGLTKLSGATSIYDVAFNDVSQYLREVSISRGKSNELSTYDAGSATVKLSNENRIFDPNYAPSPFVSDIAPTGILRISKDGVLLFLGLISDWNFQYDQSGDSIAEIQAVDGFWLLTNLTLNEHTPADNQSSTLRMQVILTRPEVGWDLADTDFSTGTAILGGDSSPYLIAQGTGVLEYLQAIEKSESGRLFMGKDGKLIFKSRLDDLFALNYTYQRQNLSTNPSFENNTTGWNAISGSITRTSGALWVGTYLGSIAQSSTIEHVFNASSNATYTCSFYYRGSTSDITVNALQSLTGSSWELKKSITVAVDGANNFALSNYLLNPAFTVSSSGFTGLSRIAGTGVIAGHDYVGSGVNSFQIGGYPFLGFPFGGGATNTISAYIKPLTANITYSMQAAYYDQYGNYMGASTATYQVAYSGTWNRLYHVSTSPNMYFNGTEFIHPAYVLYNFNAVSGSSAIYVDACQLTYGNGAQTYIDGDLADTSTTRYSWYGSAWTSWSFGNGFERASITFTTDADYINGKLQIVTPSTNGVYIDAVLIEPVATLEEYFDGSNIPADATIDGITYTYSGVWNT